MASIVSEQSAAQPRHWRDHKRYAWLLGLIVPTLPFLAFGLVEITGLGIFWLYGPFLVFVIFPLLDLAVGMDATNPPDSVIKWLEQDRYYRWCTYLYIPIQYAGLVLACWLWSSGKLSTVDDIGLAFTMGMVSGIAINTAHELGHKRANPERWLARSRSRRAHMGTSSSSTIAATTCASPPLMTPPAHGSARASTRSAAHRLRQPALGLGARGGAPGPHGQVPLEPWQRHLNAWAMTSCCSGRSPPSSGSSCCRTC